MAISMISYLFEYEEFLKHPGLYSGSTYANNEADFYSIFSSTIIASFFIYLSFMFYYNKKSLSNLIILTFYN